MHGLALRVVQHFAVEREVAHVAHGAGVARIGEALREQVELVHDAVFQVVADGEARVLHAAFVRVVDVDELGNPSIEQLAGFNVVTLGEFLERGRLLHGVRDFAVLVHARAAVAVELAKRHVASALV